MNAKTTLLIDHNNIAAPAPRTGTRIRPRDSKGHTDTAMSNKPVTRPNCRSEDARTTARRVRSSWICGFMTYSDSGPSCSTHTSFRLR